MLSQETISYMGLHTSLMRNTLNMTSISVAIIGFASLFSDKDLKSYAYAIKTVGAVMFVLTAIHGIHAAVDFSRYLDTVESSSNKMEIEQVQSWRSFVHYHYIYIILLAIVGGLFIYMRFNVLRRAY